MINIANIDLNKENLIISNLDTNELQKLHEAKNPQNLINTLNSLPLEDANIETIPIQNEYENDNEILSPLPFDLDDEEEDDITKDIFKDSDDTNTTINEVVEDYDDSNIVEEDNTTNENTYPKTYYISKEDFKKFVKSLSILKNFKQNLIFENGVTYFISDTTVFICKFNTNIKSISLKIPFVDQQANQLSFLTKSKNAITIIETEDDYSFIDGLFKFQLRKSIPDTNILDERRFTNILGQKSAGTLIAEYEFTDKNHLETFLSILKGVKRPNIEFRTTEDNSELILDRGDINSGKFELLRIPCINSEVLEGMQIDSLLDSVCLLYDYKTLKIEFYYESKESDALNIFMKGTIGDDYDVVFISRAFRDYTNRKSILI